MCVSLGIKVNWGKAIKSRDNFGKQYPYFLLNLHYSYKEAHVFTSSFKHINKKSSKKKKPYC